MILSMLTNVLSSLIYDVGKRGIKRCFYTSSTDDLLEQLNENYKNSQYTQQEIVETLAILRENQDTMFNMLSTLISELELKTTVTIHNNQITFNVPASDIFKLEQVSHTNNSFLEQSQGTEQVHSLTKAVSKIPDEKEVAEIIAITKQYFNSVVPIEPKSVVFKEWFSQKCGKKAVFFKIDKMGYYLISRAEVYKAVPHEPRLYIVDTKDFTSYIYYEAVESQGLSDGNNIVIKTTTDKGYIVAVSGSLI